MARGSEGATWPNNAEEPLLSPIQEHEGQMESPCSVFGDQEKERNREFDDWVARTAENLRIVSTIFTRRRSRVHWSPEQAHKFLVLLRRDIQVSHERIGEGSVSVQPIKELCQTLAEPEMRMIVTLAVGRFKQGQFIRRLLRLTRSCELGDEIGKAWMLRQRALSSRGREWRSAVQLLDEAIRLENVQALVRCHLEATKSLLEAKAPERRSYSFPAAWVEEEILLGLLRVAEEKTNSSNMTTENGQAILNNAKSRSVNEFGFSELHPERAVTSDAEHAVRSETLKLARIRGVCHVRQCHDPQKGDVHRTYRSHSALREGARTG